jgi:hypothetical protein|tara:strand:- start:296 stop:1879 length:1584 start_codon:yes stop_codon:yes gene_type:complete
MEHQLLELFTSDNSRYLKSSLTGEDDERGKKQAHYATVHEPVTASVWKKHLSGEIRLGLKPEINGECKWACIDVDPNNYKDYSEKKYVEIIKKYSLPLVPVKSKSGGLHIFIFFTELANVKKVVDKLSEINEQYFLAQEIFPCNKAVNMPYHNMNASMEFAFDANNTPVMIGRFLELSKEKQIAPKDFYNFKVTEYEAETEWKHYPPCVQKLIQEGWSGNNRNNFLFNVLVLEMKKNVGLTLQALEDLAQQRNLNIFSTPLSKNEVSQLTKSVHKGGYEFQCPPKHPEYNPICNKELCKTRRLGIGDAVPEIIEFFENINYIQDTKNIWYEFDYKGERISVTPEDMKDEKAFRVKLLRHRVYWLTLPKPRKGPSPFELLMKTIVDKAEESTDHLYNDTVEEERYSVLKDFFESHIEQDKFEKLKDGYVVLDSKTNTCYFKKLTLDRFLKKNAAKTFNTTADALRMLGCKRADYKEGEKNVWFVDMPDFVSHQSIKTKKKDTKVTEMDEKYYDKFRTSKSQESSSKND